jgi:capsular polysaccharide export protein
MLDAASVKAELFMKYALFKNLFPNDIYAAQNVNAEFNKYVANIRQCKTLDDSQKERLLASIGVKNEPLSSQKIDLTSELNVANEKAMRYQNAYYKAAAGIELTFETIRDAVLNRPVQELSYSADMSGIAFYDHDYTVVSTVFKNMVFSRRIPAVDKTVDAAFLWGNGQSPANMCAMGLGLKYNIPVFICEDGFLRSADTWCNYKADPKYRFGCSLIFDARTCYYDATKPSTVELMLNDKGLVVSEQDKTEARRIIDRIVANKLTKYNHQPIYTPQIGRVGCRKVLVVDQSYGDFAIKKGWADDSTFERMLDAAIEENPNADILVKTHPDAMTGVRKGYYDNLKEYGNVFRVTMPINPYSLMEVVDKVYVCSTQFGFEALMAGKEVHVFGMPFYAGWGLTIDDQKNQRRTNKRSLEEVFYIFYILYTHWMNPKTGKVCSIDESIDYLIRLRDEYKNASTTKSTNVVSGDVQCQLVNGVRCSGKLRNIVWGGVKCLQENGVRYTVKHAVGKVLRLFGSKCSW